MPGGTSTSEVGLRRRSSDLVPAVTVDLALSPDRLAEANREVDEALRGADMPADIAIIISILLGEIAAGMRGTRAPHMLRLEAAAPERRLARLSAPAGTPGWPPSSSRVGLLLDNLATRWGTVHENGESLLWLQLPPAETGAGTGAASALARALPQLRTVRNYGEVAAVLADVVAPRIGAVWASLGISGADGVRIVDSEGIRLTDPTLPFDAELPITAVCRTGRAILHATPAEVAEEFPRLHARMAGAKLQSLAHVPATMPHRTVAAVCFGWPAAGQAERYHWLLTVLADLVAEAVVRIGAQGDGTQKGTQSSGDQARMVRSGRVELDLAARSVRTTGRPTPVVLTGREFAVLLQLLRHAGTPQPRSALLEHVWGNTRTDTSVVDVTMSRLRRKLELPELMTVKDVGYVFDPDRGSANDGRPRPSSVR